MFEHFRRGDLRVNLKLGKTEVVVALRGPGKHCILDDIQINGNIISVPARTATVLEMHTERRQQVETPQEHDSHIYKLHVAPFYKHMGGITAATCRKSHEIKARATVRTVTVEIVRS